MHAELELALRARQAELDRQKITLDSLRQVSGGGTCAGSRQARSRRPHARLVAPRILPSVFVTRRRSALLAELSGQSSFARRQLCAPALLCS